MTSDVEGLVRSARARDPRAIGKLLSMVEDDDPALPALMSALLGAAVKCPTSSASPARLCRKVHHDVRANCTVA